MKTKKSYDAAQLSKKYYQSEYELSVYEKDEIKQDYFNLPKTRNCYIICNNDIKCSHSHYPIIIQTLYLLKQN